MLVAGRGVEQTGTSYRSEPGRFVANPRKITSFTSRRPSKAYPLVSKNVAHRGGSAMGRHGDDIQFQARNGTQVRIRVLIADDHAVVRQGLKHIISETADMIVAGEAADGWEVIEKAGNKGYDAVLLDISLPGKNGIEILKELKRKYPRLPVLILSIHPEDQYALRALKAGASGYLTKESSPGELVEALEKISRGGKYVTSTFAEELIFEISAHCQRG